MKDNRLFADTSAFLALVNSNDVKAIFCFDQRFETVFEKEVFPTTDN